LLGRVDLIDFIPVVREPSPRTVTVPLEEFQAVLALSEPVLAFALQIASNAGLRIGSIVRLAPKHIINNSISMPTKCSEWTNIEVTETLATMFAGLASVCREQEVPFLSHFGVRHSFQLSRRLRAAQKIANCSKRWTFHDVRRTFARALYSQTKDLIKVQNMMAHKRPDYTLHYLFDSDHRATSVELEAAAMKGKIA
jgi:integrase